MPSLFRKVQIGVTASLEVCMGMGFLWDSLGNGSSFGLLMGMGIRIVRMGMGVAYFIGKKINFIGKKNLFYR